MKLEIKNWFNGGVLFSFETDSIKVALEAAVKQGAYLEGAYLEGAYLKGAYLKGATGIETTDWFNQCSRDILYVLYTLKPEVPFLREKLIKGEVNGSCYIGDCACLIGTLANGDGGMNAVCQRLPFYKIGTHNPAEQWFWNINIGDTPENSFFAKHALTLIDMVLDKPVKKPTKPAKAKKKAA